MLRILGDFTARNTPGRCVRSTLDLGSPMSHRIGAARAPALAVPMPETLELDACYRYCEALCRARHHNYPVASFFTRSHLRKHVYAVFAFARVADDFADEPQYEGRRAREL